MKPTEQCSRVSKGSVRAGTRFEVHGESHKAQINCVTFNKRKTLIRLSQNGM